VCIISEKKDEKELFIQVLHLQSLFTQVESNYPQIRPKYYQVPSGDGLVYCPAMPLVTISETSRYLETTAEMHDCSDDDNDEEGLCTHFEKASSVSLNMAALTMACCCSIATSCSKDPPPLEDMELAGAYSV